MLEGTENDITSSPILTSRVLSNFGGNKEVIDFSVNLCFVTLQLEPLWGDRVPSGEVVNVPRQGSGEEL